MASTGAALYSPGAIFTVSFAIFSSSGATFGWFLMWRRACRPPLRRSGDPPRPDCLAFTGRPPASALRIVGFQGVRQRAPGGLQPETASPHKVWEGQ